MNKNVMFAAVIAAMFSFTALQPSVFAGEKEGKSKMNPMGWFKGEKKGWKEGDVPPGLSKKDAEKAEKESRKKMKEKEKEARKNAKKAEKEKDKAAKSLKEAVS